MLRPALIALLLANALFFAWAQGWFGAAWPPPGASQREPERMAAQVHPERFVLLSADAARAPPQTRAAPSTASTTSSTTASAVSLPTGLAASSAAADAAAPAAAAAAPETAALTCLETGPLTTDQLAAINRTLTRLGVDTAALTEVPLTTPVWMVFAGRFADGTARRTRLQAWQRQGVPVPNLVDEPRDLAPGLVFSRHLGRAPADAALQALASRHPAVANVARVVQAPAGSPRLSLLRAAAASPALAQRLAEPAVAQQERFTRCSAP